MENKMIGVYEILNLVNNKRYIGSTKVSFKERWGKHLELLTRDKHPNIYLQRAWSKYGRQNFEFNIVEICEYANVSECEQSLIDHYGIRNLYNVSPYSTGGNPGKPYPDFYDTNTGTIIPSGTNLTELARKLNIDRSSLNELVREKCFMRKGIILLSNKCDGDLEQVSKQLQFIRARWSQEKSNKRGRKVVLTLSDVKEIRQKYTGKTGQQTQLAKEYGVSCTTINHIVHYKVWSWVK